MVKKSEFIKRILKLVEDALQALPEEEVLENMWSLAVELLCRKLFIRGRGE